jgi:hypothetical protein
LGKAERTMGLRKKLREMEKGKQDGEEGGMVK